ncbi:Alpha/Beta hydrolase protein [Panaeolus papilionaceus]|nr:Alpha/Beta hydrolase protein [Panaeolus papilionaceus]
MVSTRGIVSSKVLAEHLTKQYKIAQGKGVHRCATMIFYLALLTSLVHFVYVTASRVAGRQTGTLVGASIALDYATLKGLRNTTTGIIYFQGIPYADPPIGNLRWRAPISPPSKKLGTIDATEFGTACVRASQITVATQTSEDCLFGNVYIPINTQVTDKLPVLVWFHGGGYQSGSSHTALPELILRTAAEPLILVSFDYRLGQFGFLGGSQIVADGNLNAGLLDQKAALQWVQKYIFKFGGDPGRVTLWGQSAGAGSAMFHMMANRSSNQTLFHSAIIESPPFGFTPNNTDSQVQNVFNDFAKNASAYPPFILWCLINWLVQRVFNDRDKDGVLPSRPDEQTAGFGRQQNPQRSPCDVVRIWPHHRWDLRPTKSVPGIQYRAVHPSRNACWIKYERRVKVVRNTSRSFCQHLNAKCKRNDDFKFLPGQYPRITPATVNQAFEHYPLADYEGSISLQAQQMYGEARYICPSVLLASKVSAGGNSVYQYHYDNPHLGSNHHDELDAQFAMPDDSDTSDLALFTTMRQYWTSFVARGNPASLNGPVWQPEDPLSKSRRILLNPNGVAMEDVSDKLVVRCAFWNSKAVEMQV